EIPTPSADKKKRNKRKKKRSVAVGGEGGMQVGAREEKGEWELSPEDSVKMLPWTYLGVELHPALLFHLHRQGFYQPTPIQKRVLPKALLGRKDIIGAAETGSGKTLAYGLPVLNELLFRAQAKAEEKEGMADDNTLPVKEAGGQGVSGKKGESGEGGEPLQALVLCPTRELALQVCAHLKEVIKGTGLAVVVSVGSWVTGVEAGEGGEVFKAPSPALPSKLRLCSIKSLQMDKDVYAYLFCTLYPGRTLIFVNAIACARRVVSLLVLLNVPATPLHAQMQQRQRLKSLVR
ncbi:unnamed protein product, partial [Choristocarpus tenellus]